MLQSPSKLTMQKSQLSAGLLRNMTLQQQKSALKSQISAAACLEDSAVSGVEQALARAKPHWDAERDCLMRFELVQEEGGALKRSKHGVVPTVLNSELACLKRCFEIVRALLNGSISNSKKKKEEVVLE
jgi:hypothetical protein